jgi:polyhydroxybutyrate depolymerase
VFEGEAMMRALLPLLRILPLLLLAWVPALRAASPDCGLGAAGTTRRVAIPDTGRAMLIHVPAGFRAGRPAPLLFAFHGSGETGAAVLRRSRLEATSDRHGFLLAAPDGGIPGNGGFVWNIPGVPSVTGRMPDPGDANDVAFVEQAIGWLAAQRCVDRTRVYATGISGGGRMTSLLGCIAADRFAAIAPVVGLRAGIPLKGDPQRPDPASCHPSRPMPVIAFAGDKDRTNPIEGGGASYWQYSMHAAEARWAALNGCTPGFARRAVTASVYEESFGGCRAGSAMVARITIGGTHDWVVDNEAMWAFLSRYRLR